MAQKNNNSFEVFLIVLLFLVLFFSPQITQISGGFSGVTGMAISQNALMNVTIGNRNPIIPVANITTISASQSITLDSYTNVSFQFVFCDPDGTSGLKANANFTGANDSGNFFVPNMSCTGTAWSNATCFQNNCTLDIWYWYNAGSWNFSVNATDGTNWAHENGTGTFQLGSTTGMTIGPANLTWPSLTLGDTNKTSVNDPVVANNTGNYNVSVSKVNVTATDLVGEATITQYIGAANFSVAVVTGGGACSGSACLECEGTQMVNATSTNIASSMLAKGNHSMSTDNSTAQEALFVCLRKVPTGISPQSYSSNINKWIVGVS